jgi:hypothetical protein
MPDLKPANDSTASRETPSAFRPAPKMQISRLAEGSLEVKLWTIWTDGRAKNGRAKRGRATEERSSDREKVRRKKIGEETVRREKMPVREKVEKTVLFQCFVLANVKPYLHLYNLPKCI